MDSGSLAKGLQRRFTFLISRLSEVKMFNGNYCLSSTDFEASIILRILSAFLLEPIEVP